MSAPDRTRAWRRGTALLGAAAAVFVAAVLWFFVPASGGGRHAGAAPLHGRDVTAQNWHASFRLTDTEGRERTLEEFRGKVVLLAFGYTHCPDVCPTTLAMFAQVRKQLGADGARVQGVFVTIDPERDTAALLRNYVPAFDPSFVGLRGSDAQTDAATRALHADYRIISNHGEVLVEHTATTYLIDPRGRVRAVTPYEIPADDLAQDVRALLAE